MQYNVTVENNQQLRERVGLLEKRLVFKDNTADFRLFNEERMKPVNELLNA